MSTISSLSSYLQNIGLVQNSQDTIAKLTYQVDTGLKSENLQGYGTQANQLLNLESAQTTEQNYVSNNTQTTTFLSAYNSTMTQITSDATKLSASLDAFTVTDPQAVTNLQALVKALQVDVGATLNTQVGGRYLYGGTRYTTQPVTDLSALPAPTFVTPATTPPTVTPLTVALLPAPNPQTTPTATPALPPYDAQASVVNSTTPAPTAAEVATATQSYATQTTAVASNQTVSYGITSNNPTFQHLVYALQCAQAAASTNTSTAAGLANQQALIQQATSEVSVALNGSPAVAASAGPPAVWPLPRSTACNRCKIRTERPCWPSPMPTRSILRPWPRCSHRLQPSIRSIPRRLRPSFLPLRIRWRAATRSCRRFSTKLCSTI